MSLSQLRCVAIASIIGFCAGFETYVLTPADKQAVVDEHNRVRAMYGACPLEWDDSLALAASQDRKLSMCTTGTPVRGESFLEHLFAFKQPVSMLEVVQEWTAKMSQYDSLAHPLTTEVKAVREFTQIIWKPTLRVGCAICSHDLNTIGIFSYTSCRYSEAGNIDNAFATLIGNKGDTCDKCKGVTCAAPTGPCFAQGVCDPNTGMCSNPTKPDNTPCDDGDASTDFDLCTNGVCAGFDLCAGITCQPLDECHVVGACVGGVCTNPSKPDKTPCRGGAGECMGGKCLDVGGQGGGCRATPASAKHGGMALAGSPIAAADLTAAHTEPLDKGYLQDFSQVAMSGVEDGLVYRLPGDSLDEELVFKCPVGCGGQCEVYVVGYHCPACQLSMKHGVVKTAQEAGWEVAPCAPELHVDGKKQPMVSMRRVIAAGESASFPSAGGVSGLALSFTRKASKAVPDCAAQDSTSCDGVVGCKLHNQECRTEGWCPRRFSKGPFVPRTGPGCSSWCLSA